MSFRGYFDTISITDISPAFFDATLNETNVRAKTSRTHAIMKLALTFISQFWYNKLASEVPDLVVHYDVEPFLPSVYSQASSGSSAWPPRRDQTFMPMLIYYGWSSSNNDDLISDVLQQSTRHLTNVALGEGQDIVGTPLYNNYALYSQPAERMYGDNLGRLWWVREKYDPWRIMDLTGGWKF